jgi:hypothetical protein
MQTMTKREALRQTEQENRLMGLGFTRAECEALRRISMTLQRWFELECGNSNDYCSYAIERGENGEGKPFMVYHPFDSNKVRKVPIADRETGARKRLQAIVDARNDRAGAFHHPADRLTVYIQGDPRGCPLYILRPGDIPEGGEVDSYYNRGICVY